MGEPQISLERAVNNMKDMFRKYDMFPYGAALAFEMAKQEKHFVFCSSLHRHVSNYGDDGPHQKVDGHVLLYPFLAKEFIDYEEFKDWRGPHMVPISIKDRSKSDPKVWEDAIKRVC